MIRSGGLPARLTLGFQTAGEEQKAIRLRAIWEASIIDAYVFPLLRMQSIKLLSESFWKAMSQVVSALDLARSMASEVRLGGQHTASADEAAASTDS